MKLKKRLTTETGMLLGDVCTIPSAVVTQAAAQAGLDFVIIDLEHGAIGREVAHAMIAATAGTDCSPLVRIQEMGDAHVKAALDLGAEGIVFPLIRTAEDAAACVRSMQYAPGGTRGWGPFVGHSRWSGDVMAYKAEYGEKTVCGLLIETAEAVENIDAIMATPGVDFAVLAQFDLSTALGIFGQFDHPEFLAAAEKVEKSAAHHGVPLSGGPARSPEDVKRFAERGYRIIAGFDVLRLKASIGQARAWVDDVQAD